MTIHDTLGRLAEAWNAGDGTAYGAEFTTDATYVVFDGSVLRGSAEIARTHQWLFDGPLHGSRMAVVGDGAHVRTIAPGVAVVLSGGAVELGAEPDPDRASVQTFVLVEDDSGRWRITSFQNTRRTPRGG